MPLSQTNNTLPWIHIDENTVSTCFFPQKIVGACIQTTPTIEQASARPKRRHQSSRASFVTCFHQHTSDKVLNSNNSSSKTDLTKTQQSHMLRLLPNNSVIFPFSHFNQKWLYCAPLSKGQSSNFFAVPQTSKIQNLNLLKKYPNPRNLQIHPKRPFKIQNLNPSKIKIVGMYPNYPTKTPHLHISATPSPNCSRHHWNLWNFAATSPSNASTKQGTQSTATANAQLNTKAHQVHR